MKVVLALLTLLLLTGCSNPLGDAPKTHDLEFWGAGSYGDPLALGEASRHDGIVVRVISVTEHSTEGFFRMFTVSWEITNTTKQLVNVPNDAGLQEHLTAVSGDSSFAIEPKRTIHKESIISITDNGTLSGKLWFVFNDEEKAYWHCECIDG